MSDKKTRQYVARRLSEAGLNANAVAGIMGNIAAESAFNPKATNPNGGAFGLVQWLGGRKTGLQGFAKSRGKSASDLDVQIDYIVKEINSGAQRGPTGVVTMKTLNAQGSPEAAAKFFDQNYERSEGTTVAARQQTAKAVFSMVQRVAKSGVTGEQPVAKVPGSKGGVMTWVPKVGVQVSQDFTGPGNYASGNHSGVDIPGGAGGQPIRWAPPVNGKVIKIGSTGAYGNHIVIRDEKKREWLLAHLRDAPDVKVGQTVTQGTKIGNVGNTGNSRGAHLHIEQTRPGVKWVSGQDVKRAKLKFKVGNNGQMYNDKGQPVDGDFQPTKGDFLDAVGMSGQALERPGNEELQEFIKKAVKGEWTSQEFTRRFKNLDWYKARAASQRQFDMLQDTDQQQTVDQRTSEITALAKQMGVDLSDEDSRKLAIKIARDGFTQEQSRWFIAKRAVYDPNVPQEGGMAAYEAQLKELARDYGVTLGSKRIGQWAKEGLGRELDPSNWEDRIRALSADANPHLRKALDSGLTLRQALDGKLSTAAQVLGISDPDSIDLRDEKWRNVFDSNGVELSDAQWRLQLKRDRRYGYGWTQNGLDEARTMGRNLMRSMGVMSDG